MGIVFSDESLGGGTSGPITVVTALLININEEWAAISSELKKVRSETPTRLLHNGREFKGASLYGTIRKARRMRKLEERGSLDESGSLDLRSFEKAESILLRLLHIASRTLLMYGAVDVAGYERFVESPRPAAAKLTDRPEPPPDAHHVAFDLCAARVEKKAARALPPNERLVWIHDYLDNKARYQYQRGLRWIAWLRSMGRDTETREYIGENRPPLRVIPPIYFGEPEGSLELQLADVCCATIRLKLIERFYPEWLAQQDWEPMAEPFHAILRESASLSEGDWPPEFMPEAKA